MHEVVQIPLHGQTLISGLVWRPLQSPRHYMAEARKMAEELEGMEMVAVRKGRVLQAGFAPRQADKTTRSAMRKMYSLAACVATHLGDTGIAVFALDGGRYAFIAVHKGAVLPGCDLVGDRDEVLALLNDYYSQLRGAVEGDLRTIVPADFGGGEEEQSLEQLLSAKDFIRDHQLQPLRFGMSSGEIVSYTVSALLIAALLGGAFYGWKVYAKHKQREEILAQQQREAAAKAAQAAQLQASQVRDWLTLPEPAAVVTACTELLSQVPPAIGGWPLSAVSCKLGRGADRSQDILSATYDGKDTTPIKDFVKAANALGATPEVSLDASGVPKGVLRRALVPDGAALPRPEQLTEAQLPTVADASDELLDRSMRVPAGDFVVAIKSTPWAPPPGHPDAPRPSWQQSEVTITTLMLPTAALAGLHQEQGLRVIELTWASPTDVSGGSRVWTIKGNIYGR